MTAPNPLFIQTIVLKI